MLDTFTNFPHTLLSSLSIIHFARGAQTSLWVVGKSHAFSHQKWTCWYIYIWKIVMPMVCELAWRVVHDTYVVGHNIIMHIEIPLATHYLGLIWSDLWSHHRHPFSKKGTQLIGCVMLCILERSLNVLHSIQMRRFCYLEEKLDNEKGS